MPAEFIRALDEAVKTTARESVRFALAHVQLRGKTGEIVAKDGRQLLVQGGFASPWSDTVLVPQVPAFGSAELTIEREVSVGRTKTHVAVKLGPWTFLLALDTHSRFPDVDTVIPRASAGASRLRLDPEDAEFLAANLSTLLGSEEDNSPVTLDLSTSVALRGRDEKQGITELILSRSKASGPAVRLCTDRHFLVRAVKLGFNEIEVHGADRPLACRDGRRVYVSGCRLNIPPPSCPPPTRTASTQRKVFRLLHPNPKGEKLPCLHPKRTAKRPTTATPARVPSPNAGASPR